MPIGPVDMRQQGTRSERRSMSAFRTSILRLTPDTSLQNELAYIPQHTSQKRDEARAQRAVDHAVIVGQRERQHEARREVLAVPHGLHDGLADTEYGDFGRVDDRREMRAADA